MTYGNACEARCAGVPVASEGECRVCICPAVAAPVCGADGMTYGNACEAGCAGVEVVSDGPCETQCEPVACEIFCEYGFQIGEDGCEICACNEEPQCRSNADCDNEFVCWPGDNTCQPACAIQCLVPDPVCGENGI
ncbi:MAG: Kazal-type serine protease inhibitor domain-containing protein, partial [Myxococcota bacterium]